MPALSHEPRPDAVAARTRALLDARTDALGARRGTRAAVPTRAYLVCGCGTERYGLPLEAVLRITPTQTCTALPGAPAAMRGIAAVSGTIVSVIDLAVALGGGSGGGTGHFVHLRPRGGPGGVSPPQGPAGQEPPVALAVDRALGIARIDAALAEAHGVPAHGQSLGGEAILRYAPPGSDVADGVREGFSIIDLPTLLRPFRP